tara:strand:+ start:1642 stop:1974 length:333 start_codon:yes stop_codon:yes gene_type:complete
MVEPAPPPSNNGDENMSNTYILADSIARLLADNPQGLSSYEIFNQLADSDLGSRWLPTRNAIGPKLRSIGGLEKTGKSIAYTTVSTRTVVVWTLNMKDYIEWRGADVINY